MNYPNFSRGDNINYPYAYPARPVPERSWTDNKYYIQATPVKITGKFAISIQNDETLHIIKEFSNYAFKTIPENNKLDYFSEYRENITNNYYHEKNKLKFQNFEQFKSKLSSISFDEKEDYEKIKEFQFDDPSRERECVKLIKNCWFDLFKEINFKSLSPNDQQKLKVWIDAFEKKKAQQNKSPNHLNLNINHNNNNIQNTTSKPSFQTEVKSNVKDVVYNNKDFDDFLNNLSKNIDNSNNVKNNESHHNLGNFYPKLNNNVNNYVNYSIPSNQNKFNSQNQHTTEMKNEFNLIDLDEFPSAPKINSEYSISPYKNKENFSRENQTMKYPETNNSTNYKDDSHENQMKMYMFEEFKRAVGNMSINDDICLSYLFTCNKNVLEAVNLYFQDKYNSKNLKVTFILPDKSEEVAEYSFVGNCDELFLSLYNNPKLNNPEIFYNNKKLEINPLTDRYIGNLNIINNSRLIVKSS
jgi:hypothetical protein